MGNNLIISYDLQSPNQDYEAVSDAIKSLGNWAKVHRSVWYVNSIHSAEKARDVIAKVVDHNDSLFVADASNNLSAWKNLSDEVHNFIVNNWN